MLTVTPWSTELSAGPLRVLANALGLHSMSCAVAQLALITHAVTDVPQTTALSAAPLRALCRITGVHTLTQAVTEAFSSTALSAGPLRALASSLWLSFISEKQANSV